MDLVEEFEAARPRLLSLAHRIVGSVHDAEDAVQTAWLRAQTAGDAALDNPQAWFTTVTARLCLDQLRARHRRGELPLLAEHISGERLAVDEEYLRREDISRALLVLLAQLSPSQRVAYVLHDLFAVPFEQVAAVLDVSPSSAKKLADRARIRLRSAEPAQDAPADERARLRAADPAEAAGMRRRAAEPAEAGIGQHGAIVDAFLAAARGGDLNRLIALMAPDVVRTADARLLPDTVPAVARGGRGRGGDPVLPGPHRRQRPDGGQRPARRGHRTGRAPLRAAELPRPRRGGRGDRDHPVRASSAPRAAAHPGTLTHVEPPFHRLA